MERFVTIAAQVHTESVYTPLAYMPPKLTLDDRWRPATLVAFRFCFVYFGLYVLLTHMIEGLLVIPTVEIPSIGMWFAGPVDWVGAHIPGIVQPIARADTGSGDRTFDWVQSFTFLLVAAIVTVIWSAAARRRANHTRLYAWLRVFLRLALGTAMLTYGFVKLVPLQMPAPTLGRLLEPFGNFSPMGVLWASIGASRPYEMVVGTAEVMGGLLVMIPQTAKVGALLCLVDASDVFALNMTYDVPVKLFSLHLALMSIFLLARDARPLVNLFLLGRADRFSPEPMLARTARGRIWVMIGQIAYTLYVAVSFGWTDLKTWRQTAGAPRPPLFGLWEVQAMSVDGVPRPALVTDTLGWRRAAVTRPGTFAVQRMDDSLSVSLAKVDTVARTIELTSPIDPKKPKQTLTYTRPEPGRIIYEGAYNGHVLHVETTYRGPESFPLNTRRLHWVQEAPYNR